MSLTSFGSLALRCVLMTTVHEVAMGNRRLPVMKMKRERWFRIVEWITHLFSMVTRDVLMIGSFKNATCASLTGQ